MSVMLYDTSIRVLSHPVKYIVIYIVYIHICIYIVVCVSVVLCSSSRTSTHFHIISIYTLTYMFYTTQIRFPWANTTSLVTKIYEKCAQHEHFFADSFEKARNLFVIDHFAGPVTYTADTFLDKNRDVVKADLVNLLRTSTNALVQSLLPYIRSDTDAEEATQIIRRASLSGGKGLEKQSRLPKPKSLASEFRKQLDGLMLNIAQTTPHYVRCIKPNAAHCYGEFDPELVMAQLRCAGVLEAIRVSQAGFPNRRSFASFLRRYKCLSQSNQQFYNDAVSLAAAAEAGEAGKAGKAGDSLDVRATAKMLAKEIARTVLATAGVYFCMCMCMWICVCVYLLLQLPVVHIWMLR